MRLPGKAPAPRFTDTWLRWGAPLWAGGVLLSLAIAATGAGAEPIITEFPVPSADSQPGVIAHGPDGNIWFLGQSQTGNQVGRVTPAGVITEFPIPTPGCLPVVIFQGPDGNLWFTEQFGNKIGRITTAGVITEFPLPNAGSAPQFITVGSDGNLWFTERAGNRIGRITPAGAITEFPIPTASSTPVRVSLGPDGNLWFVELTANRVAKITPAGVITEYPVPTAGAQTQQIVDGGEGNMWFVEQAGNKIGRITPAGVITEFPLPTANALPTRLVSGRDGNIWFTESGVDKIGRITPAGVITEFPVPTAGSQPNRITRGRDANLWFSEGAGNKLGRITYDGVVTEFPLATPNAGVNQITSGYDGNLWFVAMSGNVIGRVVDEAFNAPTLVAAVLPASRSVQVGSTATAFATLINGGATTAQQCLINDNLAGENPEVFTFQTTDPATNAVTGTPNTPVDIPAGHAQSFVIALAATGPFVPDDVRLNFSCGGVGSVPFIVGVNTVLLSASSVPVPDVIALGATTTGDGIVHLAGPAGLGAFAIATANIGSAASITFSADTAGASLPLVINVCQTNAGGQCLSAPPASSVVATIGAGDTPTFSVFVAGIGNVPFQPAINRIFGRFRDGGGVTRGATSVAVTTE